MLAISVSITKLTVTPWSCSDPATTYPERATNRHRGWLKISHPLYESLMSLSPVIVHLQLMLSKNWLPWQRSLDPRSWLCLHWIAWPRKPTPRIKQRVASGHIQPKLYLLKVYLPHPTHQGDNRSQRWVGTLHIRYGRSHLAIEGAFCFRFPDFPCIGNDGHKVSILGPKLTKNWNFSPLKFVREHV